LADAGMSQLYAAGRRYGAVQHSSRQAYMHELREKQLLM
jgi:hypothetical protein